MAIARSPPASWSGTPGFGRMASWQPRSLMWCIPTAVTIRSLCPLFIWCSPARLSSEAKPSAKSALICRSSWPLSTSSPELGKPRGDSPRKKTPRPKGQGVLAFLISVKLFRNFYIKKIRYHLK